MFKTIDEYIDHYDLDMHIKRILAHPELGDRTTDADPVKHYECTLIKCGREMPDYVSIFCKQPVSTPEVTRAWGYMALVAEENLLYLGWEQDTQFDIIVSDATYRGTLRICKQISDRLEEFLGVEAVYKLQDLIKQLAAGETIYSVAVDRETV